MGDPKAAVPKAVDPNAVNPTLGSPKNLLRIGSGPRVGPEMFLNIKYSHTINKFSRRTIFDRFYRHIGASETIEPF